jgi:hypothetical protein
MAIQFPCNHFLSSGSSATAALPIEVRSEFELPLMSCGPSPSSDCPFVKKLWFEEGATTAMLNGMMTVLFVCTMGLDTVVGLVDAVVMISAKAGIVVGAAMNQYENDEGVSFQL